MEDPQKRSVPSRFGALMTLSRTARVCQVGLIVLGALNLTGFVTQQPWLRGLAIASVASPLPFVFSQFRGYETFAADYELIALSKQGEQTRVAITPALYSRLGGSYNRRNTYGAAASYGPRMTEPGERALVEHVLAFGICAGGPIARALPEPELARGTFVVSSRTFGSTETWRKVIECERDDD